MEFKMMLNYKKIESSSHKEIWACTLNEKRFFLADSKEEAIAVLAGIESYLSFIKIGET
jgi:hypothetical protein